MDGENKVFSRKKKKKVCAADGDNLCTCAQRSDTYVSWNSEAAEQLYQCILVNRDSLAVCAENIKDINRSVQDFTINIREITYHFCSKSFKTTDICDTCKIKGRSTQNDNPNRPWFDEECARKYSVYKNALSTFNRNRSHFNRLYLANKKSEYKSHVIKAKRSYEDESISNQPNLFPVEIHLFFFDVTDL